MTNTDYRTNDDLQRHLDECCRAITTDALRVEGRVMPVIRYSFSKDVPEEQRERIREYHRKMTNEIGDESEEVDHDNSGRDDVRLTIDDRERGKMVTLGRPWLHTHNRIDVARTVIDIIRRYEYMMCAPNSIDLSDPVQVKALEGALAQLSGNPSTETRHE